jgi:hypothetical protein
LSKMCIYMHRQKSTQIVDGQKLMPYLLIWHQKKPYLEIKLN